MKFLILSSVYLVSLLVLPAAVDSLSLRAVSDKCYNDCMRAIEDKCTASCPRGDLYCEYNCMEHAYTHELSKCTDKCTSSIL